MFGWSFEFEIVSRKGHTKTHSSGAMVHTIGAHRSRRPALPFFLRLLQRGSRSSSEVVRVFVHKVVVVKFTRVK